MAASIGTLAPLINSIYESAIDPNRWPQTLDALGNRFGAASSCVFLHDFADAATRQDSPDASLCVTAGFDPSAWSAFVDHYCKVNVWAHNEAALTSGVAVTSSMLYPDDALPSTEFHCDWLRPQDLFYAIGGVVDRQDSIALKVSFLRAKRRGTFDETALNDWQQLIPHMQRAADLHRRLVRATQRALDAERALSMLSTGVALLNRNGQVRLVNTSAESLLREHRGLFINRDGRLLATSPTANAAFQNDLTYAMQPWSLPGLKAIQPRSMRFSGYGGTLSVSVAPLPSSGDRLGTGAAVVVFLADPISLTLDIASHLRSIYKLTPAEAKLISALAQGKSLKEFADQQSLSMNTVRTQFRRSAAKIGVKRQSDVVRVVLSEIAGRINQNII